MSLHPLAGTTAPGSMLVNPGKLVAAYFDKLIDPGNPACRVKFGTSGHRGSSLAGSFNEAHVLAITQAICDFRSAQGITGPLFIGMDTHALSGPAHGTAIEVLAANGVSVRLHREGGYTPTPVISHAVLTHNRKHPSAVSDGIVITPSHNPPEDGGIKYNPPHGGPAGAEVTGWIAERANSLMEDGNNDVARISLDRALKSETTREYDYIAPYIQDLGAVIDMEIIRDSGLRIAADALGGSGLGFWEPISEYFGLDITVFHDVPDPAFRFMPLDHDGKIRMDCSSPYAMTRLIELGREYDIAFGNDPDFDRHGIVTPREGLMNPNHFLAVAVWYLFQNRPEWKESISVGKTLVSSSMIDRVAAALGRQIREMPVGFKWFVDGLLEGSLGFAGEESAGASFLRKDASPWTTDKDGFIMDLLAAEITARSGKDPAAHYRDLTSRFGVPFFKRIDEPASLQQKEALAALSPDNVRTTRLAGEPITAVLTKAPGNGAPIGGLKVVSEGGWFAARPSGTEDIYKIYAESFNGEDHLRKIQEEARTVVMSALSEAGL
ncbi:MAG TPA: alpha-D-glucose phosphate-specific phosphoglucomutase [Desulfobacteraceae bacterium]|nr:alpha-D-glucose phosphate-specific phosphoglucomutase [Desulfobacteraceae bacterium]